MSVRLKTRLNCGLGQAKSRKWAFARAVGVARPSLASALVLSLVLALLTGSPVSADTRIWSPKMGTDERKILLNAARVPVERDLGQPIVFKIRSLRVSKEWAFVYGSPQRSDGKPVDFSKSIYADQAASGDFNDEAAVLLVREGAGWRVVTYSVGFGDVVWDTWDEEFGAPAWLWP